MPKVIKFDVSALPNTRVKGNMRIGANSHDYGTSYYSMIEPPDGGYTVYENKASGGPSIRVANNEIELINLTRESSGTTYASAVECLAWFATQNDKVVVSSNDVFSNIVIDGLVLDLDTKNNTSFIDNEPTENLKPNPYFKDGNGNPTVGGYGQFGFGHDNSIAATSLPSAVGNGYSAKVIKNTSTNGTIVETVTIPALNTGDTVVVSWYAKGYGGSENQTCQTHCYINSSAGAISTGTYSTVTSEWERFYHVLTWTKEVSSYTSANSYFYSGFGSGTEFQVANPQVEVYKTSPTPFVSGSRSQSTTWYDLSGNGNNGTLTNGPTYGPEGSIVLDGTNDYVLTTWKAPSGNKSMNFWVKYNSLDAAGGAGYSLSGAQQVNAYFYTGIQDGGQGYSYAGNTEGTYNYYFNANQWYNVCTVMDNGVTRHYVNGVQVATRNYTVSNASTVNFPIGCVHNGSTYQHFFDADFGNMKVYNRVLNPSEILQNYYGGPIVTDGLVFAVDAGNLVSYPKSGTTWSDLSGNDNDGTLTNGPTFDSGNGGSIVFDDTDDYVTIGNPSITQYTYTDDFSLEVWINPDTTSGFKHLIGKTYGNYRLAQNGTGVSFRLDTNVLATQSGTLVIGKWTHIVATYEASTKTARVYQDGVLVQTSSNSNLDWTSGSGNFQLGNSPGENYYFGGKIALGRAYSKKLTDAEVLQNYNAQRNRFGI